VVIFSKTYAPPFDAGITRANGRLLLSLYVDDVTAFNNGSIGGSLEITSMGGPDQEETSWELQNLNLVNGWNDLELKLSEAGYAGETRLHALNFLRFFCVTMSKPTIMKIDNIRFCEFPDWY
jgi:hypothetical protein